MDNSYRIKANVGIDQVLNINLKQDIDIYEILSLKLKQENLYKLHSADYGVIVGRVLANDAFGVPNAKVTVFIPLSDVDNLRKGIRNIYPYSFVTDVDSRNVKFNTLPNYKKFDCHQEVGSFPRKQLVLDDDSVLEVYDKYYKYTTVTNKAGDYMIFGVPTGEQLLHVDVDLSDIGILSQEPRDFIYKGYSIDLFESPTQFKKSTNLDNLPQIQTQNASVTVYPLWGDKNSNEIAITRKDINLQYKFETTCVFLGSVVTDSNPNSISHNCIPDGKMGEAGQLTPSKGNIEMIRKTVDDRVEEYPIKGNQLIDGDGTWCYQIPMNLDYVGMDEYGNIVPTNNPLKGIPTRARVRFRVTLDESGEDNLTRHRARYLIPNNPDLYEGNEKPCVHEDILDRDLYYEFGTLTPEDCFRDLYWNKVYSVKNYIPRIQMSKHEKTDNYLAIKGVNKKDAKKNNPLPFNKLNLNISIPAYFLIYRYGIGDKGISGFWRFLRTRAIPYNTDNVRESILEELDGIGLDFYNDWLNGCLYFPSWFWHIRQKRKHKKGESAYDSVFCECKNADSNSMPGNLYLYNNCSLVYRNNNLVIETYNEKTDEYLYNRFYDMYTSIPFGSKQFFSGIIKKKANKDGAEAFYYSFGNKIDNNKISGNTDFNGKFPEEIRPEDGNHYYNYVRLFSTDIILLGSLKDCDFDGVPKIGFSIPSTTSNIPPMGKYKPQVEEVDGEASGQRPSYDSDDQEENFISHNGMNWGGKWGSQKGLFSLLLETIIETIGGRSVDRYKLGSGLFFGLSSYKVYEGSDFATSGLLLALGPVGSVISAVGDFLGLWDSDPKLKRIDIVPRSDLKTCVNAERLSELGVTLDGEVNLDYDEIGDSTGYSYVSETDGLITKREIEDVDSRALFATLNYNKLIGTVENYITGYKKYDLKYFYPTNFDGRMGDDLWLFRNEDYKSIAENYTFGVTTDDRNKDYLDFKFGNKSEEYVCSYRSLSVGYDGKQSHIKNKETNNIVSRNISNGNYNEYEMGNGFVKITRFIKPKNRHFYGYNNGFDKVYPLNKNTDVFNTYPYAFPLYDNSFYFYFGLNQGSTAIDKFYEQFYSECPSINKTPFVVETSVVPADACNVNGGIIRVNTQEITFPYSIQILEGDTIREERQNLNAYDVEFINMPNGEYKIVITDVYGTTLTENVVLKYEKITLETSLIRGILTEYTGQTCDVICGFENDYYGKLQIKSYTLYGVVKPVESLTGSNGKYKIGTGPNGNIMMEIKPNDGTDFSNYVCTCTTEYSGNIINFSEPGSFSISVYEMCGNKESDNKSTYSIKIPDTEKLEMYINDVPLKYIVGPEEENIPYTEWYHNSGETVTNIKDVSIRGWFGVHNPKSYSDLFQYPLSSQTNTLQWMLDTGKSGNLGILHEKFNYMFNLSKGAYITAGGYNTFVVDASGGEGEILLRSGMPEYDRFKYFNTEQESEFEKYITNERNIAKCDEENPNIVSENYRYVTDDITKYPKAADGIIGEEKIIDEPYDFNPKYKDKVNKAANYFAVFSNNANIIQTGNDSCEQKTTYKPYQVLPYKANDLYEEGMCLDGEENNIFSEIYSQRRYFRTEFIDRRFDYNAFFITGHRGIHYDINDYEENIIDNNSIWDKGRISAVTYNGIDMLYKDDNGKKLIISTSDNTEYKYNLDDCTVELNLDKPKRFYESKLYYGDGKYVDLIDAFYYGKNGNAKAFYNNSENEQVFCTRIEECTEEDYSKDNFGFDGSEVKGYPSKRLLNYNKIPYGDNYTFHNVGCNYNGIDIVETDNAIKAVAVPGEVVDFNIESGELINLECGDFESDCKRGYYNIQYKYVGGNVVPEKIHDLQFRIDSTGSTGFNTKVEKLGVRIWKDDSSHNNQITLKSAKCLSDAINIIEDNTVWAESFNEVFDTSEEFKNHVFKCQGKEWDPAMPFMNMFFDRLYYSHAADSLMKRIRVFNASTIYNISSFGFSYVKHETTSKTVVIPAEEIQVDVETQGSGTIPPSEEGSEGQTVSVDSSGTGSGSKDAEGKDKYDYTEFLFTSKFLSHLPNGCLERVCFRINYGGDAIYYTLNESNVGVVEKGDGFIKYGVIWLNHKSLLEQNKGAAEIIVYMKIKNQIKSKYGEGHMEFAFGFKIQGTSTNIIDTCDPSNVGGMNITPD